MKHFTSSRFWQHFDALPPPIQQQARDHYEQLKQNPQHPSLHNSNPLKMEHFVAFALAWGIALGVPVDQGVQWFWIGSHADYNKLLA
ncbi:MAG: hypothetical protein Q7U38_10400 [Methylobacter sp.]|nr:hypothetical protein [Methylobacter sp.]MDP2097684.1 hypothetical protein [Methylobacter sp.]MDP2428817.1 hypothetical protein [Methylobacter sp.]MDP3054020.1 hypothetical protein [Methylobacter sp.]MDP3361915.1 hypothetical protein [Methylobacter sp.]